MQIFLGKGGFSLHEQVFSDIATYVMFACLTKAC